MFALGVTCAVREANYNKYSDGLSSVINRGAFGAAAVSIEII